VVVANDTRLLAAGTAARVRSVLDERR
jgi:hypothetical protein